MTFVQLSYTYSSLQILSLSTSHQIRNPHFPHSTSRVQKEILRDAKSGHIPDPPRPRLSVTMNHTMSRRRVIFLNQANYGYTITSQA